MSKPPLPLLPHQPQLPPSTGPWCVALVKGRNEDRLAWWLINHGIPYFLPMDRLQQPLFKGFVFVGSNDTFNDKGHPGPALTGEVKKSQVVLGFLFTANQPRLHSELELLSSQEINHPKVLKPSNATLGHAVRFTSPHCFSGYEGRICGVVNKHQKVISVAVTLYLLGQVVSVDVQPQYLELV